MYISTRIITKELKFIALGSKLSVNISFKFKNNNSHLVVCIDKHEYGFAMIADEIGKLANSTQNSLAQINDNVKAMTKVQI